MNIDINSMLPSNGWQIFSASAKAADTKKDYPLAKRVFINFGIGALATLVFFKTLPAILAVAFTAVTAGGLCLLNLCDICCTARKSPKSPRGNPNRDQGLGRNPYDSSRGNRPNTSQFPPYSPSTPRPRVGDRTGGLPGDPYYAGDSGRRQQQGNVPPFIARDQYGVRGSGGRSSNSGKGVTQPPQRVGGASGGIGNPTAPASQPPPRVTQPPQRVGGDSGGIGNPTTRSQRAGGGHRRSSSVSGPPLRVGQSSGLPGNPGE